MFEICILLCLVLIAYGGRSIMNRLDAVEEQIAENRRTGSSAIGFKQYIEQGE